MFNTSRTPTRRRMPAALAAAGLLAGLTPALSSAWAQEPPPPAPPSGTAPASHPLRDRFAAANTTHDGRLTREQAEGGGMKVIAKNFDAIDVNHRGYVTLQDVRAFTQARRAARQGPPPAAPQD
jgi:hypothetical protein